LNIPVTGDEINASAFSVHLNCMTGLLKLLQWADNAHRSIYLLDSMLHAVPNKNSQADLQGAVC